MKIKFIECLRSKPRSTCQNKGQLCYLGPSRSGMAETFKMEARIT